MRFLKNNQKKLVILFIMALIYTKEELDNFKDFILNEKSIGKSLKYILETNKELPSRQTVYNWLNENHINFDKNFLDNYARANEDSADLDAENIQEIAEKTLDGTYDPNAARVAIDAFKWTAGKKRPKKYGNALDLTSDHKPIQQITQINLVDATEHIDT